MKLLNKEIYFKGETEETSACDFLAEIESVRSKHMVTIDPKRTAFLIMDMQDFFFNESSHAFIPSAAPIIKRISRIRDKCRDLNIPVIFTRHVNSKEYSGQMSRWWRDILTREDKMSRIIEELYEPGIIIVEKSQYNAFYKTRLENILD